MRRLNLIRFGTQTVDPLGLGSPSYDVTNSLHRSRELALQCWRPNWVESEGTGVALVRPV